MIHTNRWKPDTCGCEILFQWDDADPDTITGVASAKDNQDRDITTKKCPDHDIDDAVQLRDVVLEENQRKNFALARAMEVSSLYRTLSQTEKDTVALFAKVKGENIEIPDQVLRDGVEVKYEFDKDRNVVLDLVGFTAQEKAAVDLSQFGNKVKVKNG